MDYDKLVNLFKALEREGVRYVLFGAVALGVQGLPRATEDVDLFIPEDAENVERLKRALRSVFADPNIDEITAEDLMGEYPTVRYFPEDADFGIDIVSRLGDACRFEDPEAEEGEFGGAKVIVASPRTLYRMKRTTIRPKDRVDAGNLKLHFDIEDD